jgi:hypothetical protein
VFYYKQSECVLKFIKQDYFICDRMLTSKCNNVYKIDLEK